MAVAVVGYVAEAWNTTGQAVLTLPAGTVAGQMAVVEASHADVSSPMPSGWTNAADSLWWKMLTAADITAGTVTVKSWLTSLTVLSGGAGIGRTTEQAQVKIRAANGGAFYRGFSGRWFGGSLAPATYRLGAETTAPDDNHKHAIYFRAASAAGYLALPSASDDADWRAYEVLAPAAPLAPLLLSPASGAAVDRNQPVTLAIGHQSASGLTLTAVRVVIRVAGGSWGSLKSDGTIAAGDTSQVITTSSGTVTIAAGVLTANTSYEWYAYSQDSAGWSPASATSTLVARVVPTATVTLTTASGDLSPTVTATITPGSGTVRGYALRISPAADGTSDGYLWESGQIATTATGISVELPAAQLGTLWTNGAQYRVWLLPVDTALSGVWTASAPATVSWTPPTAPSGIVAADGSPPTVTISGVPAGSTLVQVQTASTAVDDWKDLATITAPGTSVVVSAWLAPYQIARRYRARAWAVVDTVPTPSAWIVSAPMSSTDMDSWIVAQDRTAAVRVYLADAGALVPIQGYSRTTGLGDVCQRVDRTPVAGWECWWLAETDTAIDEATLKGWLTDPDRPLLWLKPTPERSFTGGPVDGGALLTAVADRPDVDRWASGTNLAPRHIKWAWITQDDEED